MKPMLSATLDCIESLNYPVLVSPKLDGIRCLIVDGIAVSRNFKRIPNDAISTALNHAGLTGLDGELIVGDPKAPDCYRKTNSGVMSHDGDPDWTFWVFDDFGDIMSPFFLRLASAKARIAGLSSELKKRVRLVTHVTKRSAEELHEYEAQHILAGYEGVMVRHPEGLYKYGRSTPREGALFKLKRFTDGEARVVGFEEQMQNNNEKTRDELGRAKRSSHKENKRAKGTLGALKVVDKWTGVHFDIGTGFTDKERFDIWADRPNWLNKLVKYKSLAVGVKEKPRHPVYLGERLDI